MIQEYRTTRCAQFGEPEFRFRVDTSKIVRPDIDWFVETLENWVDEGERFTAEQTVQIGWSIMKLDTGADNTLLLLEPDYVSMPIVWMPTVTSTLLDLRSQKDVCESYFTETELTFPSLRESCIVCTELGSAEDIMMDRQAPARADSGWFIGCLREAHDHNNPTNLERLSLYEAVLRNRVARMFLALPPDVLVAVTRGKPEIYHHGVELTPKNGSFIERILQTPSAG